MRPLHHATLVAVAIAACLLPPRTAHAVTRNWVNPVNGAAGTAANWNPAAVPGALDSCAYNLNGVYQVTFGSAVPMVAGQLVQWGGVSLRSSAGTHTVGGDVQVGRFAAQPCSLAVTEGVVSFANRAHVGTLSGTNGVLKATGGSTRLEFNGVTEDTGTDGGTGVLALLDGATAVVRNGLPHFGWNAGSGTLRVAGVNSGNAALRSAYRDSSAMAGRTYFGNFGGTGRLEVTDGAYAEFSHAVHFGPDAAANASAHVGGAGALDSARAVFRLDLAIGQSANSDPAGAANFTLAAGGVVEVLGSTLVGDPEGDDGAVLNIRGGSRFVTHSLSLTDPANQLVFGGGRLQVNGGVLDLHDHALTLDGVSNTPRLELLNGATCDLAPAASTAITVGETGAAELHVLSNSLLSVNATNIVAGDQAGADGWLDFDGLATHFNTSGDVTVGREGHGTLTATNGAYLLMDVLRVGSQGLGSGNVTIRDGGSQLQLNAGFALGGTLGAANGGGAASLAVSDFGLVRCSLGTTSVIWPSGTFDLLAHGTLVLDDTLDVKGLFRSAGDAHGSGALRVVSGGRIEALGELPLRLVSGADTTGRITAIGALTLGSSIPAQRHDCLAKLETGVHHLTMLASDSVRVGNVVLAGGTYETSSGFTSLSAGARLQGYGLVRGGLRVRGKVFAEGLVGLSFAGEVSGPAADLSGTLLRFAPGGSFTGAGALTANVWVDSAATLRASGTTQLGDFFRVTAALVDGTLAAASGVTTNIVCSDTTRVRGTVKLEGGTIFPWYAPLHVRAPGRLEGSGSVPSPVVVDGRLAPGGTGAAGRVVLGSLLLRTGSRTEFELGSSAGANRDTIAVTGNATLGGTLELQTLPGFAPAAGDSFRVLSAASVTGTFASVKLDGSSAAGEIVLHYRANEVWAVVLVAGLDAPATPVATLRFAPLASPARTLTFSLELPADAGVTAELFDVTGRRVATLQRGVLPAGKHVLHASDAGAPANGLYFARLEVRTPDRVERRTARVTLLH